MRDKWPFESVVRDLIRLLVAGDYAELERRSAGVRLTAGEIAGAVSEYPCRLVLPPPGGAPPLDVVPIAVASSPAWSVNVPLWTAEEGRSDLTLQLTVHADPAAGYRVEIDNLLVP